MINQAMLSMLWDATLDTLIMVGSGTILATVVGLPAGILLTTTAPNHILEQPLLHRALGGIVSSGHSLCRQARGRSPERSGCRGDRGRRKYGGLAPTDYL